MEKRAFKFGKTSFAIILPKKWIDKNDLKTDNTLFVSENEAGDLVLSTKKAMKKEFEIKIDSGFKPRLIGRWVGRLYLYGFKKVKVSSSDKITEEQMKEIEDEIKLECSGFEITQQTNDRILIEDFTDLKEISIEKVISRLRYLIKQQFEEAKEKNTRTVRKIESLVDRFNGLGIRYLNMVEPKDTLKYYKTLSFLEDIADNVLLIAENFEVNVKLFDEITQAFDLCFDGFKGDFEKIQETSGKREKIYKLLEKSKIDKLHSHLIKKIIDYITGISEFGLKKEISDIKADEWTKIK